MRVLFVTVLLSTIAAVGGKAASFDELAEKAAAARRANQIPEAIAFYRQAVELRALWAEGWWFLGTLSYASFQYADCQDAFDKFVKLDDKRPLAWTLLGLCEFETGAYDRALDHLRRGLAGEDLAPDVEPVARFHYGLLLSRAGNFDQGRRELERYARGAAREPMLVEGLGLNALHERWLPNEIPAERRALIEKAGIATSHWILGETDRAESGFQELLQEYPTAAGVHYLYGFYLSSTRPGQAMAELRRELELDPANADAAAMLALLLMHTEDTAKALRLAEAAATEQPSDALAEYACGEVLAETGDARTAIAYLEAAERLDPAVLQYRMALAGAYSQTGRYEDARRERKLSMEMAARAHAGD